MIVLHIPVCYENLPKLAHRLKLDTGGKYFKGICTENVLATLEQDNNAIRDVSSPVCYAADKQLRDGYKLE
jgi:hypothetical protein